MSQGGRPVVINYATNPSYENDPLSNINWNSGYYRGVTDEKAFSGNKSFFIVAGPNAYDKYIDTYVNLPAGSYTASMRAYITGSGSTFMNRQPWIQCASSGCSEASPAPKYDFSKINQWQELKRDVNLASPGRVWFRFYAPTNNTTYFDGLMAVEKGKQAQYRDGDSPDWAWNGAPHASTSQGPSL